LPDAGQLFAARDDDERDRVPLRETVGALGLFVGAGLFSFFDPNLGVLLCAVVFAAAAWRDPDISLFLLVFSLPFDRFFHIPEQPGLAFLGMQVVTQVLSELWHRRFNPAELGQRAFWIAGVRAGVWPLIAIYVLFAVVFVSPNEDAIFRLKTMVFGLSTLALLITLDGRLSARSCRAVVVGLFASALFQLFVDVVFRAGLLGLLLPPDSLAFDPVINGRLMGMTLNANFLAAVFLAAFCFVYADLLIGRPRNPTIKLVLLGILYSGMAQTVSKGALLASFAILLVMFFAFLLIRRRPLALRTAGIAALCGLLVLINLVIPPLLPLAGPYMASVYAAWTAPRIEAQAPQAQQASSPASQTAVRPAQPNGPEANVSASVEQALERKFRVRVEAPMVGDIDHKNVTISPDIICHSFCAGQRTVLWPAGWKIVRQHWLTGFGFGGWKYEMHALLGYPYASPHNATLHLWGMFGLAGLVLNLLLYARILRRAIASMNGQGSGTNAVWVIATTTYLLMVVICEAVETTEILSLSRFGLFTWIMLAMQGACMLRSAAGPVASGLAQPRLALAT
jgi:O-Antigen ligase